MRRAVPILLVLVLLAIASAPETAGAQPPPCTGGPGILLDPPQCEITFIARQHERTFVALDREWTAFASRWVVLDHRFITRDHGCHAYGAFAGVHVRESTCDGRLTIGFRSDQAPRRVSFLWTAFTGHAHHRQTR